MQKKEQEPKKEVVEVQKPAPNVVATKLSERFDVLKRQINARIMADRQQR